MDKDFLEQQLKLGLSCRQIGEMVGLSRATVLYWTKKYGISQYNRFNKPKYVDEHMFNKIDTKEKAYIVGFLAADGCIKENELMVSIALRDKEILDFIAAYTGAKVQVSNRTNREKRQFPKAIMHIKNKNITRDLAKHGCKKEERFLPIVSRELKPYLLLGFFDGDGCVTYGVRKDRKTSWCKVCFTSSYKLLCSVQNILLEECDIASRIYPKSNENCFVLEIRAKANLLKLFSYLYQDNFVVLKRKYDKFNALRLELGEFGEGPLTPSEAADLNAAERVETRE